MIQLRSVISNSVSNFDRIRFRYSESANHGAWLAMAERPSEQSEAFRLKDRFKKKSECTKIFDDWDESIQSHLQDSAGLEDGELPILAFYQSETHWFLVTSRRLLCLHYVAW